MACWAAYLFSGGLGLANHNYASGDVQGNVVGGPTEVDRYMLLALWSDVVWTNAELSQLYAWAKSYAADFGISV